MIKITNLIFLGASFISTLALADDPDLNNKSREENAYFLDADIASFSTKQKVSFRLRDKEIVFRENSLVSQPLASFRDSGMTCEAIRKTPDFIKTGSYHNADKVELTLSGSITVEDAPAYANTKLYKIPVTGSKIILGIQCYASKITTENFNKMFEVTNDAGIPHRKMLIIDEDLSGPNAHDANEAVGGHV